MGIRVLLADDHMLVRQGLKVLLEKHEITVAGEAADGQEALQLAETLRPDLAVLDLSMPVMNGLEAGREICRRLSGTKVIMLTMHREDRYVLEALKAGISGYVLKSRAASELVEAIREVARGSIYLSPSISRTVVDAFLSKKEIDEDPLTSRERQVLQLVAEGKTTKEVANVLGLSVKTAESHRTRIMEKLNIHETAGLVRYAVRRGIVQA